MAPSGTAATAQLKSGQFDLLLLDIGMPGLDGWQVLEQLRRANRTLPVVLLTARDAVEDRIRGLDLGADDYLVKPVAMAELAARVRAHGRRRQIEDGHRLVHGPLVLDCHAMRARIGDHDLGLTSREWKILEFLMRRVERVVSKQHLIDVMAVGTEGLGYNAVEVHVSRLRAKLEPCGIRVRTVRGFGYMLEEYRSAP
jgi:two-component system OmpR family response regulator